MVYKPPNFHAKRPIPNLQSLKDETMTDDRYTVVIPIPTIIGRWHARRLSGTH
jgi:hypothetical protein